MYDLKNDKRKKDFIAVVGFLILVLILKLHGDLDVFGSFWKFKQGEKLQNKGQYEQAEQKYIEAMKLNPNSIAVKEKLASMLKKQLEDCFDAKDYNKAIYYGEKLLKYDDSKSTNYYNMGSAYYNLKNYPKAYEYYKKVLSLNPNDTKAQQLLEAANYYIEKDNLNTQLNNVRITKEAPSGLYQLIKTDLSTDIRTEAEDILDLIWAVPEGQILLKTLWTNKIPIIIVQEGPRAEFNWQCQSSGCSSNITIPVKYLNDLNNFNIAADYRIYNMNVFMHEMGHAFCYSTTRKLKPQDSLEEELDVSMIGYNIAYKIVTGKYLDRYQTKNLSRRTFSALLTDDHKDLPVYSGVSKKFSDYGIFLPYAEFYSNLPEMYQQLLSEGKTSNVPNLDKYLNN